MRTLAVLVAAGVLAAPSVASANPTVTRAIVKVFGRHAKAALRVAACESHLNPRAVGAAGERGVFQIHPIHFEWVDEARLWEPLYNARIAYRLSRGGSSWAHWTCKP